MNEYGFDYMNYINNIPNSMNYNPNQQASMHYMMQNPAMNQPMGSNMMMNNQNQVLEPSQGFMRGNMFGNLYDPYKNYKPANLDPKNEKEALLYQVMQYKFALNDLDLYLDTHPNDKEMIALYNKYLAIEKQMCDKYENMYGPLTLDSNYLGTNTWNWKNSPWPWEGV